MADTSLIAAEIRTEFGKGAARRIRRAHKIPAVLYGHGTDPVHLSLPTHETFQALKVQNAILTLNIDGKQQLALAKDVQRDPIKPIIDHVDLVVVRRGEKVHVEVGVHVEGEPEPETIVSVVSATVEVEAEATHIPEWLTFSVEGLEAGTQITADQLELPRGVTLLSDPETLVINLTQAVSQEALEAELAEAESEAGIEHEAPETEEAAEDGAPGVGGGEPAAEAEGSEGEQS